MQLCQAEGAAPNPVHFDEDLRSTATIDPAQLAGAGALRTALDLTVNVCVENFAVIAF
jgi:hypothetical protein